MQSSECRSKGRIDQAANDFIKMDGRGGWMQVRCGSKADLTAPICDFRFAPDSGHVATAAPCPLGATTGLMHRSK